MKNIQDQIVHLQHIIQLLPLINRDTLYVLLQFLGLVAENAEDKIDESGEKVVERFNFFSNVPKVSKNHMGHDSSEFVQFGNPVNNVKGPYDFLNFFGTLLDKLKHPK